MKFSDCDARREKFIRHASLRFKQAISQENACHTKRGTTFAGTEKVCSDTITPNVAKANKLRVQNYW